MSRIARSHVALAAALWLASVALVPLRAAMSAAVSIGVAVGEGLTPTTDSDADGIPDTWEYDHFYNTTTVSFGSDYDGDGSTDGDEYLAGTDPRDPAAFLQVAELRRLTNGLWRIVWDSSTNPLPKPRAYDLYSGSSVSELACGGAEVGTNIATEGAFTDFDFFMATISQRYFRVRIHP